MASLKSFLPVLARILATTPDALYSRQRALVNLGLLDARPGRGPGSGVDLSIEAVAILLIACLCSDSLAGTDQRVIDICKAINVLGRDTFRDAVVFTLSEPDDHFNQALVLRVSQCFNASRTFLLNGDVQSAIYDVTATGDARGVDIRDRFGMKPPIITVSEVEQRTLQQIRVALRNALLKSEQDDYGYSP